MFNKCPEEMKFDMVIFPNSKHFVNLRDMGFGGDYYMCKDFRLNLSFQITVYRT